MKRRYWYLALILVLALFLRLWHLEQWFHFTMDEELIAWRGWGLFNLHRPFLIGGISPLQVHLPPYFYYFSALLFWPFRFDPVGWGIWAGLFSLMTVFVLYRYSKSLVAALLYATSLTAVIFDRHYWPLYFNPLFALITLWSLKGRRYLTLMLTLIVAVTTDPTNLALVLFVLLLDYRALLKYWWLGLGIFFGPLILFDLRHGGVNIAGIGRLLSGSSVGLSGAGFIKAIMLFPQSLARFWFEGQTNLIQIYSYCVPYAQLRLNSINVWLLLAAITIILIALKRREFKLLLIAYALGLGIFGFLGYPLFDHYLTGLMPLWAILSALVIKKLPRAIGVVVVIIFLLANLYQFSRVNNPYGLSYKKELIVWSNTYLVGSNWDLESDSKCHRENGLRYLFELSGNPPGQSFMDPNFAWLYPNPPSTAAADKILLVTDKPLLTNREIILEKSFGAMTAYILRP